MSEPKYSGFLPGRHVIEGYGGGGFRFGGMSHRGSILALPSGIKAWGAIAPQDISIESLASVFDEVPGTIEHLLVGTGLTLMPMEPSLRKKLRDMGMTVEPMATGAAARTYSILLAEDRLVAAALLAVP